MDAAEVRNVDAVLVVTGVTWPWWGLALFGYFFYACVGHSVGYHRYFAHRSFRAPRWADVLFTVAGTLGCIGSPVGWAQMHRRHHMHSDREGDPYTAHRYPRPTLGVLLVGGYDAQPGSARSLRRMCCDDPLQRFVMRYYFGIVARFAGLLLMLDWRLFLFGWAVPVGWTLWMSGIDAWSTHRHGYRNHETGDGSRKLWWCALLVWGDGWHNNHHANPRAWSYRERWWEWDPGAAVVWVILRLSNGRDVHKVLTMGVSMLLTGSAWSYRERWSERALGATVVWAIMTCSTGRPRMRRRSVRSVPARLESSDVELARN